MSVIKLTEANFEQEVMKSDKPVLIDFFADWCGPCSMVSPIVDQIGDELSTVRVCKVNVDEEPALAEKFGVDSIPKLVVIKDGKVTRSVVGSRPKNDILALLD